MDKKAAVELVDRFRKAIEARGIRASRIILYGSYAAGAQQAGSDIDIVVISEDFAGKGYWERIDILTDAVYEIFAPLEATALTPDEWDQGDTFIADFARDGEVLYAA
ncbi:nucleotidyltransferase domain-containing protein [Desulfococcus multivorans]|uniref:DNA polymerase beta domain protein region n=1 Tax=Desulfococcus multivorans DSM 2059 TaxID=1121405 RepID=S7TAY1_DESML|nr:nucleotidyltransferase domain-containing protein [Desulfococcus multivorans]AQV02280.1 nucleotidyltransferase [Desulfococcus multivorans]EPR34267.1 DNA polymerase beta domain protein region [Desulfococcus multivorans DSM 2059]SKA05861.1 hypothetical protein SAMN02745446_02583 [Desulfococcus multivorans DSM 2059]